jgi:hypothetical protein
MDKNQLRLQIVEVITMLLQDKAFLDYLKNIPQVVQPIDMDKIGVELKDALSKLPLVKADSATTKLVLAEAQKWVDTREKSIPKPNTDDFTAHANVVKHKKKIEDMKKREAKKREQDCIAKIKELKMEEWVI